MRPHLLLPPYLFLLTFFLPALASQYCPVKLEPDPPKKGARVRANTTDAAPRIVNGDLVGDSLRPYLVSIEAPETTLRYRTSYCTGTLVSANWVVTAAHCTVSLGDIVNIGAERGTSDGIHVTTVTRVVAHEAYPADLSPAEILGHPGRKFDIAALQIADPAPGTTKYMKVNADKGVPKAGTFVRVAGFGNIAERDQGETDPPEVAGLLRQVDVPVSENNECRSVYDNIDSDAQVCAGYKEGNCDSCQGDSGGPMIHYSESGEPILTGVISFGHGCARPDFPGVYVRTSEFDGWLSDNNVEFTASGGGGVSAGAIAGIVIAVLIVAAIVGVGFVFWRRKGSPASNGPPAPPAAQAAIAPLYTGLPPPGGSDAAPVPQQPTYGHAGPVPPSLGVAYTSAAQPAPQTQGMQAFVPSQQPRGSGSGQLNYSGATPPAPPASGILPAGNGVVAPAPTMPYMAGAQPPPPPPPPYQGMQAYAPGPQSYRSGPLNYSAAAPPNPAVAGDPQPPPPPPPPPPGAGAMTQNDTNVGGPPQN